MNAILDHAAPGAHTIVGSANGTELLAGGIGNDTVTGGAGNDMLQGGRSDRGMWTFTLAGTGTLGASHQATMSGPAQAVALAELDGGAAGLAFLAAPQATLAEVALLYQAAFDRAPDIAGLNHWIGQGATLQAVARGIMMSAEWTADGDTTSSDLAFVRKLYQRVLGREGDDAGVDYWVSMMGRLDSRGDIMLSRADVLLEFALGSEHRARFADGIVVASDTVMRENGWIGGSGDDRLEGGAGSDWLAGGDGTDTAVFSGRAADYRLHVLDGGHVVLGAGTEADTLAGIEKAEFADGTVDLSFTQGGQVETLGLLYQAVLDRDADLAGIGWWAGEDMPADQLAAAFAASAEFRERYDSLSNDAFVEALYAASDLDETAASGTATWLVYLQSHSRAELVGAWIGQADVIDAQFTTVGL
ncbi:DUF4214 domain-containing protein [Pseudoduganella lutea]|nr:DUF4214 domain-containing protein [Pseudoduganella lutea]